MTGNKKLIIAIVAIIAAAIVVIGSIFALQVTQQNHYTKQISIAREYLSGDNQSYESAVAAFKEAIQMDPSNETAYMELARVYISLKQWDDARAVLDDGISHTESQALKDLLESIAAQQEASQTKEDAPEASLDLQLLSSLDGRTYQDYQRNNGIESALQQSDGSIHVRARGIAAELIFRNSEAQPNAVDGGNVNDKSLPEEIVFDDIMQLFGGGETLSAGSLNSMTLEGLSTENDKNWGNYITFTIDKVRVMVACDENGNIVSGARNLLQVDLSAYEADGGTEMKGVVMDAQDGTGVSSVTMTFRKGTAESGSYETQVKTDSSGNYQVTLEGGDYTVELSAEGYTTDHKSLYINTYGTKRLEDFTISRELAGGEARIVLSWGAEPRDLDAHLVGAGPDGKPFHISWLYRTVQGVADLDYDVQSGYGPETVTISDVNGSYHYYVHDYTYSGGMISSGATVTVYMPGASPVTIDINASSLAAGDNVWDVCTIENGTLYVTNQAGSDSMLDE